MNVDAYFDKPLVPAKLLAKIEELLAARGGRAPASGAADRARARPCGRRGGRLMPTWDNPLITIIGEKCRMCYACVRECPAKAIQVVDGQARVIQPRCIGCGNCLRVCSQNAKQVRDDTARAFGLLESRERVVRQVAPSFPAEFTDISAGTLVAMIRALGFDSVHEISLGADLVAHAYRRLLEENPEGRYITTPCPASVSYVRKYHPRLMPYLAPIVSPMVAMARVLRHDLGPDIKVVFMGPCVAKKRASIDTTHVEVDAVLTFAELRDMFSRRGIKPEDFDGDDRFDPPYGGLGAVFPIAGGLLQTAGLTEDLLTGELVVAEGRGEFIEAITEFDLARADTRLLDVLSCAGCFAGPGMTSDETMLQRRSRVSTYARNRLAGLTAEEEAEVASAVETVRRPRPHPRVSRPTPRRWATAPRRKSWTRSCTGWASSGPRTCSTAAPAATTPASTTPTPCTPGWPTPTCASPTPSSNCSPPTRNWRCPTSRSRRRRRPSSARASSRAWASWPPASRTR